MSGHITSSSASSAPSRAVSQAGRQDDLGHLPDTFQKLSMAVRKPLPGVPTLSARAAGQPGAPAAGAVAGAVTDHTPLASRTISEKIQKIGLALAVNHDLQARHQALGKPASYKAFHDEQNALLQKIGQRHVAETSSVEAFIRADMSSKGLNPDLKDDRAFYEGLQQKHFQGLTRS